MSARLLYVHDLGLVEYDEAWAFQKAAAAARIAGKRREREASESASSIGSPSLNALAQSTDAANADTSHVANADSSEHPLLPAILDQDLLILCEHPPVVTLGRSTKAGNLLATPEYLGAVGVQLREVERGGDVTVHEPGQLVAYPIIDLERHRKDLHWYLRQIEEVVIVALETLGLRGERNEGLTGVWIDARKIASIGVHARDWVTWHGVALNVVNDLSTFAHVVPCGIGDVTMTSVAAECLNVGRDAPSFDEVRNSLTLAFAQVFALEVAQLSEVTG